jgi:hypothetical protein
VAAEVAVVGEVPALQLVVVAVVVPINHLVVAVAPGLHLTVVVPVLHLMEAAIQWLLHIRVFQLLDRKGVIAHRKVIHEDKGLQAHIATRVTEA